MSTLSENTIGQRSGRNGTLLGLAAAGAWALVAATTGLLPDVGDWPETENLAIAGAIIAVLLAASALLQRVSPALGRWLVDKSPWLIAIALFLSVWQLASAKLGWLPQPFFPPPQGIIEVFTYDYAELGISLVASAQLLIVGFIYGGVVGFIGGVALGWSQLAAYWIHPILRFVGPLPSTALLPIIFFAFPSSYSASIFLVALAVAFPMTVLTWSGIASVNPAYYDVARTLGASPLALVLKVAIPASLPYVFVGLFMALGAAFSSLMVAELLGVKAGLGFFIQWSQGWGSYNSVFTAVLVLALLCSFSITALFKIRGRVLSWQKGLVKW
ncbi:ABC transporter permease [Pseudochelatococcus contaminans]|uniref:NitT/TauT family transport system permease protein n=1 Tax=Pseudochelatococcus contaminans TaxID=1538103 RepID=A0A7W6EHU7_9HYPH|nr:ABC transporter permease subunit [Pseudochelatococcus contaminans]MBB3810455.1 NitT/TauT family transport system permease protein [Pseudochelatococcus contaminans]